MTQEPVAYAENSWREVYHQTHHLGSLNHAKVNFQFNPGTELDVTIQGDGRKLFMGGFYCGGADAENAGENGVTSLHFTYQVGPDRSAPCEFHATHIWANDAFDIDLRILAREPSAEPPEVRATPSTSVTSYAVDRSGLEKTKGPVLLYVDGDWCPRSLCGESKILAEKIAAEYVDKVRFMVTDIGNLPIHGEPFDPWTDHWIAQKPGDKGFSEEIRIVPMLVFFIDGKEKRRFSGGLTGEDSVKREKLLRCAIEIHLLRMAKEEAPHCAEFLRLGGTQP